jgi:hypothetical protein
MKTHLRAALGLLALVAWGCDASPPAHAPTPPASGSATAGSEPDFTYESLVELLGNPDDFEVARTLGERLPKMGPGSVPAMQEVLEDAATLELDAVEFELLMRYWAQHDVAGATWYALTKAPRAFRVGAIHATLRPWAKADPQKALETARVWTAESGDGGAATQIALVRGWYDSGKPGLEEYIRDLGASFERQRALSVYATAMIRAHGVEAVTSWAEAVPETDATYKLEVFRAVGRSLVPFDIAAAQRFCDRHCEGPFGSNLRDRIASRWSEKDGAAAMEWLAKAPKSEDRDTAIRFTFATWSRRENERAIAWMKEKLAAKPEPEWIQPTLPVFARVLGRTDPAGAIEVASRLTGPLEREQITVEILRGWRQRDEAAAEAWLAKSSLSENLLTRVRAPQTKVERAEQEQERRLQARPAA